jgi:hypothetical protein
MSTSVVIFFVMIDLVVEKLHAKQLCTISFFLFFNEIFFYLWNILNFLRFFVLYLDLHNCVNIFLIFTKFFCAINSFLPQLWKLSQTALANK